MPVVTPPLRRSPRIFKNFKSRFVFCFRCKSSVSARGFRKHTRICFGLLHCAICNDFFPCRNDFCPWKFPDPPTVPAEFVPFLWGKKRTRNGKPKKPDDPELEAAALRWREHIHQVREFLACSDDPRPSATRPLRRFTY